VAARIVDGSVLDVGAGIGGGRGSGQESRSVIEEWWLIWHGAHKQLPFPRGQRK
jgi:hypothetical protein